MRILRRRRGESEATRARKAAERALEETRAETPQYRALGESLRELREANHFALAIRASFRGEHQ